MEIGIHHIAWLGFGLDNLKLNLAVECTISIRVNADVWKEVEGMWIFEITEIDEIR